MEFSGDPSLKRFHDWDFILELGKKYPEGFMHIPFVVYEYIQKYGGDSMCSSATYQAWADGFEAIYQKHKNDPLMKGQTWYPAKIEKYKRLQEQFEKGQIPPAEYKDFPEYWKNN